MAEIIVEYFVDSRKRPITFIVDALDTKVSLKRGDGTTEIIFLGARIASSRGARKTVPSDLTGFDMRVSRQKSAELRGKQGD